MRKIYRSQYKNVEAVTMESDRIKVQFLPRYGGKMASYLDKKTSREFLVQAPGSTYKVLEFAGVYTEAECSGMDDMFPTIDQISYPNFPWRGTEMADHGEVCGLPWDCEIGADHLSMSVYGVRFPYKLEKRITFETDSGLKIDYKASNLSVYDLDFLWAAHPMIDITDGAEILLPFQGPQDVRCIFSSDPALGAYGDRLVWPETVRKDGSKENLAKINKRVSENTSKKTYKYFFKQQLPEGWCAIRYLSEGTTLKFSFPEEQVPYLGIWTNEGAFKGHYNVALEMCTGSMDRPDLAKLYGQNSILKGKSDYSWYLKMDVE